MSELVLEKNITPKGWTKTIIEDIAINEKGSIRMGPFGSQLKKHELVDRGIRVLWIENVVNNRFEYKNGKFITKKKFEVLKGFEVNPNDVLITMMGTIGRTCIVPQDIDQSIISSHLLKIRPNQQLIDSNFIAYLLRGDPKILKQIDSKARGVVMKGLNTKIIKSLEFLLPPLNEQKRIVVKIEELFSLTDSTKQILEKTKILLNQYRQSVLKLAFKGKLVHQDLRDESVKILEKICLKNHQLHISSSETNKVFFFKNDLPTNWALLTLPCIVQDEKYAIQRGPFGGSLKKEIFKNKGYLVYEQFHAINDDFSMTRYFIDEKKYHEMYRFKVKPHDMIISCSGVTLGRIAQIPENALEGIINQALLKISLNPQIVNGVYFKFLFRSDIIQNIIFRISRGTGMPNFPSLNEIKSILFPIPPLNEQKRIVEKIEEHFSLIQNSEKLVDLLLLQNNFMKHSILKQAFEGKLISQDPNDEPVEILLEKIKQEKQNIIRQAPKTRKKKNDK